MRSKETQQAVAAASSLVSSLGLQVDDAVILNNSNKLTLRLLPCDVLARVAPKHEQNAEFELEVAQRLADVGSPVAALDPRVEPRAYELDGFVVTLWTYYEATGEVSPSDYARALEQFHAGMLKVDVGSPRFTDRVEEALQSLADRDHTPDLAEADRELLSSTLRRMTRAIEERQPAEQLLHGEPHPGNLLNAVGGPVFIDLETCCRGPVEFDLAHAPAEVSDHYPGVDRDLLRACRILMLAIITTWRWDRDDQLPDGRQLAAQWMGEMQAALASTS
ncbi:aminoglycoside phosphotransferase family protein [Kribbella sp. NPDC023855]|uniref:aminoglycoside phosphotransferase family protein n=1 Tax=Kribbella sp. NPDC023855 TaxID=3154698 RepID=UPI0034024F14